MSRRNRKRTSATAAPAIAPAIESASVDVSVDKAYHASPVVSEQRSTFAVCGDTGYKRSVGILDEEFLAELKGSKGRKVFVEMLDNDAGIAAATFLIESLVCGVANTTEPNKSGHPQSAECAKWIDECFDDMERPWPAVVADFLTTIQFGWAYLEPLYKLRKGESEEPRLNSRYSDGRYGWRDWQNIGQESLDKWELTDSGRVVGLWQARPSDYKRMFIPADRALHVIFRPRNGSPEGRSCYRGAYTSYYYGKRLREIEAIGIERDIAGLPVMELPTSIMSASASAEDKAVRATYESMVKKIRVNQMMGLAIPAAEENGQKTGYLFRLASASGKNISATDPIIRRYETRLLMVFLSELLAVGSDKVGSHSLHSDKTTNLAIALGRMLDVIDDVANRYAIPRLCRLEGYPVEAFPRRKHGDIEKVSTLEFAQAVATLVNSGAITVDRAVENVGRELLEVGPAGEDTYAQPALSSGQGLDGQTTSEGMVAGNEIAAGKETAPEISLNGAQISSLLDIIAAVAERRLPRESAVEIIMAAFQLDRIKAERMLGQVGLSFYVAPDTSQAPLGVVSGPAAPDPASDRSAIEASVDDGPDVEGEERSAAMNVQEAADYLNCSTGSIMGALRRGQLPGAKVGAGWRIMRSDLDTYMRGVRAP